MDRGEEVRWELKESLKDLQRNLFRYTSFADQFPKVLPFAPFAHRQVRQQLQLDLGIHDLVLLQRLEFPRGLLIAAMARQAKSELTFWMVPG